MSPQTNKPQEQVSPIEAILLNKQAFDDAIAKVSGIFNALNNNLITLVKSNNFLEKQVEDLKKQENNTKIE